MIRVGILGATAAFHPLLQGDITRLDLGANLALSVVLLVLFATRLGPSRVSGGLLLASVLSFAAALWQHRRAKKRAAAATEADDADF